MSYELSGLGAVSPISSSNLLRKQSMLPHLTRKQSMLPNPSRNRAFDKPGRLIGMKRRALPHEIHSTIPRLPPGSTEINHLTGLGFSLKPPKFIRKLTLKKVIKPLAITAAVVGAAFIPGALPFVGKAAGVLAKGAVGAGKFVAKKVAMPIAKGFMSKFKKPSSPVQTTVEYGPMTEDQSAQAAQAAQNAANQAAQNAANQAAWDSVNQAAQNAAQSAANQAAADAASRTAAESAANQAAAQDAAYRASQTTTAQTYTPAPTYAPSYGGGGGGGGGGYSESQASSEAPSRAGMDTSTLIPIGLGLVALIAVSGALNRGRK
jgi:hypothetical protein